MGSGSGPLRSGTRRVGRAAFAFTALLAARSADVTSVEALPRLALEAQAKLKRGNVRNVRIESGDAAQGYGTLQYDAIVLTGSTPVLPDSWRRQLKPGGRLFAVVGDAPVMTARLMRWTAPGAIVSEDLFETVVGPLRNAAQPQRFVF